MKHLNLKKLVLAVGMVLVVNCSLFAQSKSQGRIEYEVTINLHAALKPEQQHFKDFLPEKTTYDIIFLYKEKFAQLKDRQIEGVSENNINIGNLDEQGDGAKYLDMQQRKFLIPTVINNKAYLLDEASIKEDLNNEIDSSKLEFVEGNETKEILGFNCKKIVQKSETGDKILWCTTEIPILGSPLGVLPPKGVILAMESKSVVFMAKSIVFDPVDDASFKQLEDALIITYKEFLEKGGKPIAQ